MVAMPGNGQPSFNTAHSNDGFTYLGLLFAIAIMGIALAAAGSLWQVAQQRDQERELLYIGNQYRQAIALYYEKSPGGGKQFPKSLENLLQDNRHVTIQRYLRKLYRDPITNSDTWGIIEVPGNTITGVYSLSEATPIKQANFEVNNQTFNGKTHYSDWKFVYVIQPPQALPAGASTTTQTLPAIKPP